LQNETKTGQNEEKQQILAKRDEPGAEPPCQRNRTVGPCHMEWSCPRDLSSGFAIFYL